MSSKNQEGQGRIRSVRYYDMPMNLKTIVMVDFPRHGDKSIFYTVMTALSIDIVYWGYFF